MPAPVKNHGVELHGKAYRYRMRIKDERGHRVTVYKTWSFIEGPEAKKLEKGHPLRKENAYANALAFALRDRSDRKTPRWRDNRKDPKGSLLEWLVRYQTEALEQRRYLATDLQAHLDRIDAHLDRQRGEELPEDPIPHRALHIQIEPRAAGSVKHDKSQIRSMVRLGREHAEILAMLEAQVATISPDQIHHLLAVWSGGKARPRTKRRLINTLSAVWNHHSQFYGMKLEKPWEDIDILGDGTPPKARAIPKAELAAIEAEFGRLHPTVRAAIEFLRWTGARRSEAEKLRWEKIVWPEVGEPAAHFQRTKAARGVYKARFVYLEEACLVALARMVRPSDKDGEPIDYDPATFDWRSFPWPKKGWVFPAPTDPQKPIHGQTIYQAFVRSVRHAGVPHASPHHLRHTKATVLTATVPQAMAQEMLGHEDAGSFAIYRHMAEEAGYMVRDKAGQLVSADELKTENDILEALKKLPLANRASLISKLIN